MELWRIIFIIVTIACALLFIILATLSFLQKGPLLNNTYVENKNKKPYYYQSGILFVLLGIFFVGICILYLNDLLNITLPYVLIFVGIIFLYIIVSILVISRRNEEK